MKILINASHLAKGDLSLCSFSRNKKEGKGKLMEAVEEYGGCGRKVVGWAARDTSGVLSPYSFTLRKTGDEDVVFKVLYCGVDHTDLHQMRSELYGMNYPLVPGHEIVGEVMKLGSDVKKFKVGDIVGVGCIVGSCGNCSRCNSNLEQYCRDRVLTYGGVYKDGTSTQGGFSTAMVVHQRFVVAIPESLSPEQAAPLLCGGVTAYSPLRQFCGLKSGLKGGILGLGGVGHIAVKVAKAMGHHVTVISSSERKRFEAMSHLGADDFLVSSDPTQIAQAGDSLDYILDTVPGAHPLDLYLPLLNFDGKLLMVGASPQALQFQATNVILGMRSYLGHGDAITFMGRTQGRRTITGSFVGSIEETQELLNLWAEKGLSCMIEVVKMDYIHTAMERMERGDVRYRFVLDVAGSNLE